MGSDVIGRDARFAQFMADPSVKKNIMAAHRGEVICDVTTAKELNAAMKKEVEATIALFLKKGQKSLISYNVKPEIMGGMVVSIGDRFVDMSTASKVKKYTEIIQAAA